LELGTNSCDQMARNIELEFLILVPWKKLPNERIFKKYRKMRISGAKILRNKSSGWRIYKSRGLESAGCSLCHSEPPLRRILHFTTIEQILRDRSSGWQDGIIQDYKTGTMSEITWQCFKIKSARKILAGPGKWSQLQPSGSAFQEAVILPGEWLG